MNRKISTEGNEGNEELDPSPAGRGEHLAD